MVIKFPFDVVEYSSDAYPITGRQDRFSIESPCVYSLDILRAYEKGVSPFVLSVNRVLIARCNVDESPKPLNLPMRWHVAEPLDTGWLEMDVGGPGHG